MRVTVVGGGVVALITAVECVLSGHQVAVVDQGPLPATRGASPGRRRISAALDPADPSATSAGLLAQERWEELEGLLGTRFHERVGALTLLPEPVVGVAAESLGSAGGAVRAFASDELAGRYPHLRLDGGLGGVLEERAGVLFTDRVAAAAVGWLRWQPGVELYPYRPVASVDGESGSVRLVNGDVLRGDAVLLVAGARSRELLPPAVSDGLVLRRRTSVSCRVPRGQAAAWAGSPAVLVPGRGIGLVPPVAGSALLVDADGAAERAGGELLPGFGPDWITGTKYRHTLSFALAGGPPGPVEPAHAYAVCDSSVRSAPLIARELAARLVSGPVPAPVPFLP